MTRVGDSLAREGPDRREALALLSSALAITLAGCQQPQEEIVPYVEMPERIVPGQPLRFATVLPLAGYGRGMHAITIDGRPIKIEGNPHHPYSLGATDLFAEADVLSLYDPDRSKTPVHQGAVASWQEFTTAWTRVSESDTRGATLALVTGRITSPTMLRQVAVLKKRFPELRHYRYEAVSDDAAREGARQAFGHMLEAVPHLEQADTVVALDADPFGPGPAQLRNARGFALRRRQQMPQRIYVAESHWTLTGAMADHRLALSPQRIGDVAAALAAAFGADIGLRTLVDADRRFAESIRSATMGANTRAVFLAGEGQPPAIHSLCHWLNAQTRAAVDLVPSSDPEAEDHGAAFSALLSDLEANRIRLMIVLDVNPVYDAPDASQASAMFSAVPFSIHCGLYRDETAERCQWHLPLSHALESWGDLRSIDGTAALMQPMIRPLYDTRTSAEVIALLAGAPAQSARESVRATWPEAAGTEGESWWRQTLHDGVVPNSASAPVTMTAQMPALPLRKPERLMLVVASHPTLWDGRYANNAWLQECPAPFTKEVWGNAVAIAPEDAHDMGIAHGGSITLRRGQMRVDAVAAVIGGQPRGVLAANLGQGRWRAGNIGSGVGARIGALRDEKLGRVLTDIGVRANAASDLIRTTQPATKLEGRDEDLYPTATLAGIAKRLAALPQPKPGLLPPFPADEYAWAMVIDNDLCIGCNACVVACQAENNVAVVGPEEVAYGRDMHWLRVDAYEIANDSGVRRGFQPVPCMHCETAPCEPVCPVAASVHDHEGLNVQVYNRCIGTRFCEANCPYKVRRFNFFGYTRGQEYANLGEPPIQAQRNPNVSVRGRGVMEKCTYCVQRISAARKQAEKESRSIRDGEIVTACAAACPTRAIRFGNRNEPESDVARLRGDARHYALLGHLDTRPRTTYLAKVFNPDPALEGKPA
jgi:Fe-S-cluster-containing dehydrogenase component/anaerobic selenocysteine-containing dehydrogenase